MDDRLERSPTRTKRRREPRLKRAPFRATVVFAGYPQNLQIEAIIGRCSGGTLPCARQPAGRGNLPEGQFWLLEGPG